MKNIKNMKNMKNMKNIKSVRRACSVGVICIPEHGLDLGDTAAGDEQAGDEGLTSVSAQNRALTRSLPALLSKPN